jgi:hypothetical protein
VNPYRLNCSPSAMIGVILVIALGGALAAGSKTPPKAIRRPAAVPHPAAVHAAATAAAGGISHLAVAALIIATLVPAALVVRWLRCETCWRPGKPVAAMRLNTATGTLQPAETAEGTGPESAEAVAEDGEKFAPVILTPDGVTTAGAR